MAETATLSISPGRRLFDERPCREKSSNQGGGVLIEVTEPLWRESDGRLLWEVVSAAAGSQMRSGTCCTVGNTEQ